MSQPTTDDDVSSELKELLESRAEEALEGDEFVSFEDHEKSREE